MNITFEDFVNVCPSAMAPDTAVFDSIKYLFESRIFLIQGIITKQVFDRIDVEEVDIQDPDVERLEALQRAVKNYVCASAYHIAIPQLDLVLTPTGFGVVSNQNVAPASADRVRELRNQIDRQACNYLDEIIDNARKFVDWEASTHGSALFNSLFWKGEHMRSFGIPRPTRHDLKEHLPEIETAATHLKTTLSPELYRALIVAESKDAATPFQKIIIEMWRKATVAWARHDGSWVDFRQSMLGVVEGHIDEFPEYRDSQTCKANHFKRYENEKDDPCFFFS